MPTAYKAPVEDYVFLLHDVIAPLCGDALGEMTREDTSAVLTQAARFFEASWAPLDARGDELGCTFAGGVVTTPPGFSQAYQAMCAAGWNSPSAPPEYGGGGLPELVGQAVREFSASACNALGLYAGLTGGAQATIRRTGQDWMRTHVVPPMVSGHWSGTMCLTEPHCGTDLRLMKTRAVPQADGSWRLSGTKIFISGGDHDLTENVVHLVLAKVPDVDGRLVDDLSTVHLFMVAKRHVDPASGAMGAPNGVSVAGIESKMGLKASATCTMVFDGAIAYRLGQSPTGAGAQRKSSAGMSGMFDMMNSARLGTGLQAIASAQRAYDHAAGYCRERLAGRAATPALRSGGAADPIIVHPDVRRLLLKQAAFLEAARCLGLYVRMLLDEADEAKRRERNLVGSMLTPVVKAFFSDRAFETSNDAMQVMGGHGYIRDNGVEQLVRDGRIFQLYEGANGVQALDLVQRKLAVAGGQPIEAYLTLVQEAIDEAGRDAELKRHALELSAASEQVRASVRWLTSPDREAGDLGGASYDFLTMLGIHSCAFMWLRMAVSVRTRLPQEAGAGFGRRKLALARYWFERELPLLDSLGVRIQRGAASLMDLPAELF